MDKRLIFPVAMFVLAGGSFAFGAWQYVYARAVQASATQRMASIVTTIERSDVSRSQKQALYASIAGSLPPGPSVFGIDISGSFASQGIGDQCTSDGQRAICKALKTENTDTATMRAICGVCNPQ